MQDINTVCITGRLTKDPVLRSTAAGMSALGFSIASNRSRKNAQSGQYEDVAGFFDVSVLGSRADALSKILTKGARVAVSGKLSFDQWERDGTRHTRVSIIADSVICYDRRQEQQAQQGSGNPAQDMVDEYFDIPF